MADGNRGSPFSRLDTVILRVRDIEAASAGPGRAGTYPILGVGDAEAAHAFVASHGGSPGAVEAGGGVRYFGFTDPDGNFLEACQVL